MTKDGRKPVADRLRHALDSLSPAERKLARVLLGNYPVAGLETVAQFASRADVSGPTVLRLVTKLGFTTYPEFQQALRDELENRLQSPILSPPEIQADLNDPLVQMSEAMARNLKETLSELPRATFEAVVSLLADPRRSIYVLGGRFGHTLAVYLSTRLHMLRKNVRLVSGQSSTWPETLLDMGSKDVLVVFDARRYQQDIQEFSEAAAALGSPIVLFTDQWLSPIANVAAHTLIMRVEMPTRWDTTVPSLALLECLLATITDRHWDDARERLERLEALRPSSI
ncbi:MurR/RpiR family transcriptional regulator [Burkholderia sp. LMG 13014]|uniref:MurR/RpiR family transcriptional regulator n=1 Tax=Burkholderia sp. LMG 13014 TaxID=2709306 RepID=UPI001963A829|nr:MurR/RpiR family transcriptional regulator [Burkholderia sp. LMG 13014]